MSAPVLFKEAVSASPLAGRGRRALLRRDRGELAQVQVDLALVMLDAILKIHPSHFYVEGKGRCDFWPNCTKHAGCAAVKKIHLLAEKLRDRILEERKNPARAFATIEDSIKEFHELMAHMEREQSGYMRLPAAPSHRGPR
jgi:hypothetical protein